MHTRCVCRYPPDTTGLVRRFAGAATAPTDSRARGVFFLSCSDLLFRQHSRREIHNYYIAAAAAATAATGGRAAGHTPRGVPLSPACEALASYHCLCMHLSLAAAEGSPPAARLSPWKQLQAADSTAGAAAAPKAAAATTIAAAATTGATS
ncbi:hypothetical protein Efla_003785 [Eimeria flavescens]